MANVWNNYASKYTGEIDSKIVQESKTGFLADTDFGAKFVGTKNVIIPDLEMVGLGDYVRVGNGAEKEGYPGGKSVIEYETYTLSMERARKLPFDAMDADESGVTNLIAKVTKEYTKNHIIPEMDAYNISKLYSYAQNTSVTAGTAVDEFIKAVSNAEESVGFGSDELVAFIDKTMWNLLMNTDKIAKQIIASDFKQGSIDLRVKEFNGVKLILTDNQRMKTKYLFNAGTSADAGGFSADTDAKSIRALILPKNHASFVKKLDKIKIFTPEENQDGNAYIVDFHVYYDLFVKKNKRNTIFALSE